MLAPFPFALHASTGCPAHAELAVSLASSFHEVDPLAVDLALESLASRLSLPGSGRPAGELLALADALLPPPARRRRGDTDPLLVDTALARGEAHVLVAAQITVEAARRRGVSAGIVSNGREHFVAHHDLGEPLVLRALVDARYVEGELTWR